MRSRKTVKTLKHHRTSDVYVDGRYLVVNARMSLKSKRGREIARETAMEIWKAVMLTDSTEEMEIETTGVLRSLQAALKHGKLKE